MKQFNKVRNMKDMDLRRVVSFINENDMKDFYKAVQILNPEIETDKTYFRNKDGELELIDIYTIAFKLNNEKMKILVDNYDLCNGNKRNSKAINRMYWIKGL